MANPYETDLPKTQANFTAMSPLSLIARTAAVYPDYPSVVHGSRRFTWAETYARCRRLGSALAKQGIRSGDTVAVVATNIPAHYEAHFGVAMAGGVLNAINTRLDAAAIAFIFDHGEAKVVLVDRELSGVVKAALTQCQTKPFVVDIDDETYTGPGERIGGIEYEAFIAAGDPDFAWELPADEWNAISLNYTSGTTGNPKGVVYHHRGAYLNAVGNAVEWGMGRFPVYLWTLPMFHCNGWCFPWTVAAMAGVNVCLRRVDPAMIYELIRTEGVTHFCGAPTVLTMLINADPKLKDGLKRGVKVTTAGAAPPAAVIQSMEEMGFEINHVYGLTETYGPAVVSAWHSAWDPLSLGERARLRARQGVRYGMLEGLTVKDPETMQDVPADAQTMGEIMFRGNLVMKGYLKNRKATEEALGGGWFHSGDLAVMHPDGYIEIRDRSKDIIISGGENISTLEVESVLYRHPAVLEAAVVARPDAKWGETPCAFITLKNGASATDKEIIAFCRDNLAHFKCPKTVVFTDLPKTSTGKIQKFVLRDKARAL
ncbi:acyl-CoA synthetase [Desertibaculum subflavum]|uniref:acyl-CoA synthetase n=1 Tax=Desertibaculum subflavum TaxID=2268458 RepID=UPI000E66CDA5